MSDRDKKILVFVLIVAVIVLPYFLYIKDKRVQTEYVNNEIVELQARYDYLCELEANREYYITETEKYNEQRDAIIALFPANITKENYTMFLLNTEYQMSEITTDLETEEEIAVRPLIRFDSVSFGGNDEIPISSDTADTGYIALSNTSTVTYKCDNYDVMKFLLEYIMDYKDPMIYRSINLDYNDEDGEITGSITLAQYAVMGGERTFTNAEIVPDLDENDMRGNEEYGIFGPNTEQLELEALEELEDGENAGEAVEEAAEN